MSLNLERDDFKIDGVGMGIIQEANTDGWYGLAVHGTKRLFWHWGRRWKATRPDKADTGLVGVLAVIGHCQGHLAWVKGAGVGELTWHGPFAFPMHKDFGGGDVCTACWEWWRDL